MKLVIDIPKEMWEWLHIGFLDENDGKHAINAILKGTPLPENHGRLIAADVLDKIREEIMDCLKALDDIEKSGFNIFLPNEISGRRLTYHQCLEIIDKYKTESEG